MSMLTDLRTYLVTPPTSPLTYSMTSSMAAALVALQAMVGSRIYPDVLDEEAPMSAIVYSLIDSNENHILSGEDDGLVHARVQFDVYSDNPISRDTLADALQQAIEGYMGPMGSNAIALIIHDTSLNQFEFERRQYRRITDFRIHYQS